MVCEQSPDLSPVELIWRVAEQEICIMGVQLISEDTINHFMVMVALLNLSLQTQTTKLSSLRSYW